MDTTIIIIIVLVVICIISSIVGAIYMSASNKKTIANYYVVQDGTKHAIKDTDYPLTLNNVKEIYIKFNKSGKIDGTIIKPDGTSSLLVLNITNPDTLQKPEPYLYHMNDGSTFTGTINIS